MRKTQEYIILFLWILALVFIGGFIGSSTKSEIVGWYQNLNLSPLTPPNYVFGIAWTILYILIATSGWVIWFRNKASGIDIKIAYIIQLILNWIWTPLFFNYHLTGVALLVLFCMDILVTKIVYTSYSKSRLVFWLMLPYLIWILFATHLNLYVWIQN